MKKNHYENALRDLFSESVTFIEVTQSRRKVFSDRRLKNFDFLIFSRRNRYLADVKGKTFPSGKHFILESSLWQPQNRLDDLRELESYRTWQRIFGRGFSFLLIYSYWIKAGLSDVERFNSRLQRYSADPRLEIYLHNGALYGLLAVGLDSFLSHYNRQANHPRLKASDEELLLPLSLYIPEILQCNNLFSLNEDLKLTDLVRAEDAR